MKESMVIGLGGYGLCFVKRFENKTLEHIPCLTIDEHEKQENGKYPHLVVPNSEDEFLAHEAIQSLLDACKEVKKVYLVAGAGGSFGSFMTLALAQSLKSMEVPFTILFTKPFGFEGQQKELVAKGMESYMNEMGYPSISLENKGIHQLFEGTYATMSLKEAFEKVDETFIQLILKQEKTALQAN